MKIQEYGLLFQPMWFQAEPFVELKSCIDFILENKTKHTAPYQLGIKLIWNGKANGWIEIKLVQNSIYIKISEARLSNKDPIFIDKLNEFLPPMQDHGTTKVGVFII